MKLDYIFSNKYLFAAVPPSQTRMYPYLMAFFGVLILVAIILHFWKAADAKIRYRIVYCFLTCGILGYLYIFGRHEKLSWLGSRLMLVLVLLTLITWISVIAVWLSKYGQKVQNKKILADRYEKYLPENKRKK